MSQHKYGKSLVEEFSGDFAMLESRVLLYWAKKLYVKLGSCSNKNTGENMFKGMSVELLDSGGSDNSIANTARVSMGDLGEWNDLPQDYTPEQRDKLIAYLAKHKHTSPFRHTSLTFRMDVPIFLARQLGKHQIGLSWNELSRRYVDTPPTFFDPCAWRERPVKGIKQGSGFDHPASDMINQKYQEAVKAAVALYNNMLLYNVAPEMARMVLPQSMMTQVIWTGSLTAFAHVYNLRSELHSQKEAQEFAFKLDSLISGLFPVAWAELTK